MSSSAKEVVLENSLHGLAISPGIAVGTVLYIGAQGHQALLQHIETAQISREIRRLNRAVILARYQLNELKARMERELGHQHAYILDAHILMLEDKELFRNIKKTITEQLVNAEWAIKLELERFLSAYAAISDRYLRQRGSDIEDVARRLTDALSGKKQAHSHRLPANTIIVAEDLPASVLAELDMTNVVAIATHAGGWASHTAIIARSLRIPAIVGIDLAGYILSTGISAIVDGAEGLIILNPSDLTVSRYRSLNEERKRSLQDLLAQSKGPAITSDGQEITVRANIELVSELDAIKRFGAQGIGLFRSEFIFTNMLPQAGSEDGQYQIYQRLAQFAGSAGVTIRTFDLSEDKVPLAITGTEREVNPALGLRGIRLALRNEPMFRTQIRAIVRASEYKNVRIILPMVTSTSEVRHARSIVNETIEEFTAKGLDIDRNIRVGVMVEVPSAVMILDQLCREADFLSLGTNDLIQYILAVDRNNKQVSYLYQPLHPAVLQSLVWVAKVAEANKAILDVCGEMAANPIYVVVLLGLGIKQLSMTPAAIPLIKDAVRAINLSDAHKIVESALQMSSAQEIEDYICEELANKFPSFYANLKWRSPLEK
jgi:phosphoenolpyruvate-protein phosphotransferase